MRLSPEAKMKTILLPILGLGKDEPGLDLACRVAELSFAHIDGLHVQRDTVEEVSTLTMGAGAISQEIWDTLETENRHRAQSARTQFESHCSKRGFRPLPVPEPTTTASSAWLALMGMFVDQVIRAGRLRDLVVLGRDPGLTFGALSDIVMRTGRPILIASDAPRQAVCDTVAIAWKDSVESAHAVTAAIPFIARARKVIVLAVDETGDGTAEAGAANLAAQLRWHAADIERRCLAPAKLSTAKILVDAAASADLLVVGGYGHSRAREYILGGVTRELLESCPLPLLVTH
jgi:nucleotide-binding universal stress UspA family protein